MELLKKYSTLDEVFLYLKDKTGYDYNLNDIHQLELEGKIEVYFYLSNPRIRLDSIDDDGKPTYKLRSVSQKAIYKTIHSNNIFLDGSGFGEEIIITTDSMLKVHELLEGYHLDKSFFDPIPYDENHIYFTGFRLMESQEMGIKYMRFDSNQIKGLINTDIEQQTIIDHLKAENHKLRAELAKSKTHEPVENQGYLDPNNKFFSIEMKLCHDTWNELYKNGNNSHLAHTTQVENYLNNHADFTVTAKAIDRIVTITNPKAKLAGTTTKNDI